MAPRAKEDQVKGYETDKDRYIVLEAEELAATAAKSDKVLGVSAFIGVDDMDETVFDRPYYLAPADRNGAEVFALFRDGLRQRKVMAMAHAVLFRQRVLTLGPESDGLIATTLHFDNEARPPAEVFAKFDPAQAPIGRRQSVGRSPKPDRKPAQGRSGGRRKAG